MQCGLPFLGMLLNKRGVRQCSNEEKLRIVVQKVVCGYLWMLWCFLGRKNLLDLMVWVFAGVTEMFHLLITMKIFRWVASLTGDSLKWDAICWAVFNIGQIGELWGSWVTRISSYQLVIVILHCLFSSKVSLIRQMQSHCTGEMVSQQKLCLLMLGPAFFRRSLNWSLSSLK